MSFSKSANNGEPEIKYLYRKSDADHPARPSISIIDPNASREMHLAIPLKDVYRRDPRIWGDFDGDTTDSQKRDLYTKLLHHFVLVLGKIAENINDSHEGRHVVNPRKRLVVYVTTIPNDENEPIALLLTIFVVPQPRVMGAAPPDEAEEDGGDEKAQQGRKKKSKKQVDEAEKERRKVDFLEVFYDAICDSWSRAKTKRGGCKARNPADLHDDVWTISCKVSGVNMAFYEECCSLYCGPSLLAAGNAVGDIRTVGSDYYPYSVFSLKNALRVLRLEGAAAPFLDEKRYGWDGIADSRDLLNEDVKNMIERADYAADVKCDNDGSVYQFPFHGRFTYRIHSQDLTENSLFHRLLPFVKRPEVNKDDPAFKRFLKDYIERLQKETEASVDEVRGLAVEYAWRDVVNTQSFSSFMSDLSELKVNHQRRIKDADDLVHEITMTSIKLLRAELQEHFAKEAAKAAASAGVEEGEATMDQEQAKEALQRVHETEQLRGQLSSLTEQGAEFYNHDFAEPARRRLEDIGQVVLKKPHLMHDAKFWMAMIPGVTTHLQAAAHHVCLQKSADDFDAIMRPSNTRLPDSTRACLEWASKNEMRRPYELVYKNLSSLSEYVVRILVSEEFVHRQYSSHVEAFMARLSALSVWFPFKMVLNIIMSADPAVGKSYIIYCLKNGLTPGTFLNTQDESAKALISKNVLPLHLKVFLKDEMNDETTGQIDGRDKRAGAQYASSSGVSQSNRRAQMTGDGVGSLRLEKNEATGGYDTNVIQADLRYGLIGGTNLPFSFIPFNTLSRFHAMNLELRYREDASRAERIHGPSPDIVKVYAPNVRDRLRRDQAACCWTGQAIEAGLLAPHDATLCEEFLVKVMKLAHERGLRGADNTREIERVKIVAIMITQMHANWLFFDSPLSPIKDKEMITPKDILLIQPFLVVSIEAAFLAMGLLHNGFEDHTVRFVATKIKRLYGASYDIKQALDGRARGGHRGTLPFHFLLSNGIVFWLLVLLVYLGFLDDLQKKIA